MRKSSSSFGDNMLACFLDGPRKAVVRDVPVPRLMPGDVLVRMGASGICGTDLEKVDGKLGPAGVLGHEVSGTIDAIGERASGVHKGDRIVAHHHVPCHRCAYCLKGDPTMCEDFKTTNLDPCGFAEFFRVPEYNVSRGALMSLSANLSLEEGAMIEPTACCLRAIRRAHVRSDDSVLVVGLGPTGLTQLQILRDATSGEIIGTDLMESRLQMGARFGADETIDPRSEDVPSFVKKLTGQGVDLAVVATGNEKALDQAFGSVRKGGKILLFGAPAQGATYQLDVSALFSRQVSFVSSYSCVEAEMHEAMRLVERKALILDDLVTNRFKLKDADKALEFARGSTNAVKTMVVP